MKYVVAGNAVSERITFADGTSTGFMPGGATLYALLGIQLWTDEVLLCGGFGKDYMEQIGGWLTRNHINQTGFNIRDEKNPVNYMFYKDEGIWDSKTEYGVEHWDRLDCNPVLDQLGKYTENATGLAVFRGRDKEFYEQIFALREKQGFKLGWEIKGNYAVPEYLPEIRELLKSVDSFSINQTEAFCLFQVGDDDAAIKALQTLEVPLVLYRVGKRGIYILLEGEVVFAPAFTKYKVKDVTGCGNSSTSAGFYAWCEGKDIYEIAAYANVTAAHNLCYNGAMELSEEERKIAEMEMEEFASKLREERRTIKMSQTPTIHNAAKKGEIAKTVLMPGDPLRAKYIAETFLEEPKLVSDVRNIYCYTGTYKGKEVSVMASGMGAGSMSIYSYELFHFYDVDAIIRVGSAGGLKPDLKLKDVVVAMASSTDNGYATHFELPGTLAPCADYSLIAKAVAYGEQNGLSVRVGPVVSGEGFYYSDDWFKKWTDMGMLAVEMESAALYINAAEAGKKAVAICTISDLICTGEACTTEERQKSFDDMILMALSMVE